MQLSGEAVQPLIDALDQPGGPPPKPVVGAVATLLAGREIRWALSEKHQTEGESYWSVSVVTEVDFIRVEADAQSSFGWNWSLDESAEHLQGSCHALSGLTGLTVADVMSVQDPNASSTDLSWRVGKATVTFDDGTSYSVPSWPGRLLPHEFKSRVEEFVAQLRSAWPTTHA